MLLEIIGDTADGIHGVVPDVDYVVIVKIDSIVAVTARHKLTIAHCPGI